MTRLKKAIVFAVYFLLSFSSRCAHSELPAIRPVPCTNHVTGESGICTFNWSCVNVAHGVHVGPCVDRFFIGTCCKIPQAGKQDNEAEKDGQMAPYTPFHHTLATKTQKEEKPAPTIGIGRFNVTLNPFDHDRKFFAETQPSKPAITFDYKLKPQQQPSFEDHSSSSVHNRRPILSDTFFHNLFFSDSTFGEKKAAVEDQPRSTTPAFSLYSKASTVSPIFQKRSTISGLWFQNKPILNDSHDGRVPVSAHSSHDLRKPVVSHQTHDLRQPVKINEQHDLRKPVPFDDSHDLRWPVLEEDSHDKRLPVVNLYELSGNWYLNNHQKPGASNSFYSLTTEEIKTSTIDLKPTDFELTTEPSQPEELHSFDQTTEALDSTSNESSTFDSANNTISTSLNFTLFIRPTSSQPSSETTPIEETKPDSLQGSALRNISQVCGRSRGGGTTARIVGGRKSHYLRWPWMISLRRFEDKSFKHKCGATLLNEYWAITAAHCVEGKLPMDVILRLGEYNFRRADELHPHVERRVYVMILHPAFNHITYENDLALLRFNEPVRLQANIAPVCLPDAMDDITGRMAVVTGWGRLSEAGELPVSLHEVHMPILSNEECEQMYYEAGYAENIRDVFVCAGLSSGGLDACEGDSGGPMVVRGDKGQWVLVGLISWGMGCAAPKQPGVYTRISRFTEWIGKIISH